MVLQLILSDSAYIYGIFELESHKLLELPPNFQVNAPKRRLKCDPALIHYLKNELERSELFRKSFINYHKESTIIILIPTKLDLIDYNWNDRIYRMVRERCELDHALSWLSTLGGAFSALGDYNENCAETAGKISYNQLQLAIRLKDPGIESRCKLYFSLSLIQKSRFKLARKIILQEYHNQKKFLVPDSRLIKMCLGIWSKLQYEHNLYYNKLYKIKV